MYGDIEEITSNPLKDKDKDSDKYINTSKMFEESIAMILVLTNLTVLIKQIDRICA